MNDALFTDDPAPKMDDSLFTDEPAPSSILENAGRNAMEMFNPVSMAKGLGEQIKTGAMDLPKETIQSLAQTAGDVVSGQDSGQTPVGKRMEDIAESPQVQQPVQWAKKNPIDAAMLATTPVAAFMPYPETLMNAASEKAGRVAGNASLHNLGASMKQVRDLGLPDAQRVGRWAIDKGITTANPLVGEMGAEERIQALKSASGQAIRQGREAGDVVGGAPTPAELTEKIKAHLAPQYETGIKAGEKGALNKAIAEVGKIEKPGFVSNAEKATEMNRYAKSQHAIMQPAGATTDVANLIGHENNAALQKALTPGQYANYQRALSDYENIKKVGEFFIRKESREAAGRSGIGGPISSTFRAMKDAYGHRAMAVGANSLASLLAKPEIARVLPALVTAASNGYQDLATTDYLLRKNNPNYADAVGN